MYLEKPFLPVAPTRIVSVVPSQTELLHYLQLENETLGITRFCVHPHEWFRHKKRIGGTKDLHIKDIQLLQPDLIISNKEENVKAQIDELATYFPVWLTDVNNYQDALKMIADIGCLTHKQSNSEILIQQIQSDFALHYHTKIKTAYLIWKDPYMTVGGDTFINDMMDKGGFENVFKHAHRYPSVEIIDLKNSGCELILLSSEPYPFKQKHIEELEKELPGIQIKLADGEMFSWYGSRMLEAAGYFKRLQMELKPREHDVW